MTLSILSDGIVWNYSANRHSTQSLTKQQLMDLLSAKKQIAVTSKKDPKTKYYLNVDDEGEVSVSKEYDKDASGYCYRNGSEIALDPPPTEAKPEKKSVKKRLSEEIMEEAEKIERKQKQTTKESSADANATSMKNKAKRATKPVEAVKEKTVPRGNNMFLTEAQTLRGVGRKLTCTT